MIIASLYPCPYDIQDRHEFNCALIKDGRIYAYEEAKLTTTKNDGTVQFPERSLMMGCKELGIVPSQVDKWVFPMPSKPVDLNGQYLFFSWLFKAYKGKPEYFSQWHKDHVVFVKHQIAHAALAVLASSFDECAFLCQDGGGDLGDNRDLIFGEFKNGEFKVILEHLGLNTICSFHAFLSDALGFSGGNNGKVSGLAAYGKVQPELEKEFLQLLKIKVNGIDFHRERYAMTDLNVQKTNPSAYDRFKIINRYPSDTNVFRLSLKYLPMDIAATGEHVVRTVFLDFLRKIRSKTSLKKVVLCGGLFQNVPLNYRILESKIFDDVYIPMAPSDAGLSLGQALYVAHQHKLLNRRDVLSPFIGPSFEEEETQKLMDQFRLHYSKEKNIEKKTAELIAQGHVVGWFQGRGEFGPRSLGARSILADPRNVSSKTRVNQLLKKRDWFMPYAPSIQEEYLKEWVHIPHESAYMQMAFEMIKEKTSLIPAAVHVDGTSRLHVVKKSVNEKYWKVIENFRLLTGLPLILNTSFNRHGIATISTPRQAIEHLLEGCLDYLVIDDFLMSFQQNRTAAANKIIEKPEDILLKEDCVYRLHHIMGAQRNQVEEFVKNLSDLTGIKITFQNKTLIINGTVYADVHKAVEYLNQRLNNRSTCNV